MILTFLGLHFPLERCTMNDTLDKMAEWVRTVRDKLGLSQSQLASVLGVSPRAVQSYEQGWRKPPQPFVTQLMTVLALHAGHPDHFTPCWSLTGCQDMQLRTCRAVTVGRGSFCWLLAGRACGKNKAEGRASGEIPCIGCAVMTNLLEGRCRKNVAGTGLSVHESIQEEKQ